MRFVTRFGNCLLPMLTKPGLPLGPFPSHSFVPNLSGCPLLFVGSNSKTKKFRNSACGLSSNSHSLERKVFEKGKSILKTATGIAIIFGIERSIALAGTAAGLRIPSAPVGMVSVFFALLFVSALNKRVVQNIQQFFSPALAFYGAWVPLFFSPPLVQLPLALRGISGDTLLRLGAILSVGTVLSLLSTAAIVQALRKRSGSGGGRPADNRPASHGTAR